MSVDLQPHPARPDYDPYAAEHRAHARREQHRDGRHGDQVAQDLADRLLVEGLDDADDGRLRGRPWAVRAADGARRDQRQPDVADEHRHHARREQLAQAAPADRHLAGKARRGIQGREGDDGQREPEDEVAEGDRAGDRRHGRPHDA